MNFGTVATDLEPRDYWVLAFAEDDMQESWSQNFRLTRGLMADLLELVVSATASGPSMR